MSQQRHRLSLAIGSFVLSLIHSPHIHRAPVLGAVPGSEDTVVKQTTGSLPVEPPSLCWDCSEPTHGGSARKNAGARSDLCFPLLCLTSLPGEAPALLKLFFWLLNLLASPGPSSTLFCSLCSELSLSPKLLLGPQLPGLLLRALP